MRCRSAKTLLWRGRNSVGLMLGFSCRIPMAVTARSAAADAIRFHR